MTVETDHVIRVLDTRDGSRVATLIGHTNDIETLSFSTNGALLASSSADRTTRLWRLPAGEPVGAPIPYPFNNHPAVLSPDGGRLVTCEDVVHAGVPSNSFRIWRTEPLASVGKPIEFSGDRGRIWFDSPTSRRLFVNFGRQMRSFDADTQTELLQPIQFGTEITAGASSADDNSLCVGSGNAVVGVWSTETGQRLVSSFKHGRAILDAGLSPNGSRMVTATDEGACVVWNVSVRQEDVTHRFN